MATDVMDNAKERMNKTISVLQQELGGLRAGRANPQVLDRIAQRVAADGVRVSVPSPDRGSQFMPFAALKGYEEVIAEVENGNVEEALDAADAQAEEASLRYQHDEVFESIREGLRHERNV